MIRMVISTVLAGLLAMSAAADTSTNTCKLDSKKNNQQSASFNMSVVNKSEKAIWFKMNQKTDLLYVIPAGEKRTHKLPLIKDRNEKEQIKQGLLDIHADIGEVVNGQSGHDDHRIWRLIFDIDNDYRKADGEKPVVFTEFTTRRSEYKPLYRDYKVECSAKFNSSGKNSWDYEFRIVRF